MGGFVAKMKIVAIVQARVGSTRLPGKVLMKIKDKTILEYVLCKLRNSKFINSIIVATSTHQKNDKIEEVCKKNNIKCFRGSENNVLERYFKCAEEYGADHIIRITADCPLIDPEIVDEVIKLHLKNKNEHTETNVEEGNHFPRGQDVEIFTFAALEKAYKNAKSDDEKEHVTIYIKKNKFKCQLINPAEPCAIKNVRLCVDEIDDFKLIEKIIGYYHPDINFGLKDIEIYLNKNRELKTINNYIKQKNVGLSEK